MNEAKVDVVAVGARPPERFVWGLFSCLLPSLTVALVDVVARADLMNDYLVVDWVGYLVSLLLSGLLWGLLLFASARSTAPVNGMFACAFVIFFTLAWGGQRYFFDQYHAYLSRHVAQFATNFRESVLNQLRADWANYLRFKLPALLLALSYVAITRRLLNAEARASSLLSAVTVLVFCLSFVVPNQATGKQTSMPDLLYMEALGEMTKTQLGLGKHSNKSRPGPRKSSPVSSISSKPAEPRNVVLVLLESVRYDATCSKFDPDCHETPATNRAFPSRIALPQLRALDSCTIVSMGVLFSGLSPQASREQLHHSPLLFDFAHAAGYQTAYFTSQNLLFGNMGLWLGSLEADLRLAGLDVDPVAHLDLGAAEALFADRVEQLIPQLEPPYFLTIQLSNGHYPYLVDPSGPRPFQPESESKAPEENAHFFNHYRNAVHQEDMHLARILQALRAGPGGDRTVIVYTSDHGEAFREHGQMGHTFSLYDEELHVPGFIDAPPSTLSQEERAQLQRNSGQFLVLPDLTATVLDLLGIADAPALDPYRDAMIGRSLLRPLDEDRMFPLTNCTELWTCAFENWGVIRGPFKLQAREWDSDYRCFNLLTDPDEKNDLGDHRACDPLRKQARLWFDRFPGQGRDERPD